MNKSMIPLLLAGLFTSFNTLAAPELVDEVVAIVNKDVILKSQQEMLVQKVSLNAQSKGQSLPPQDVLERQALDRLIQDSLQLQLAERAGLKISDAQLEQALIGVAGDNKMSVDQMRQRIEADGMSYAQYREEVRNEMLMNEVRRSQVRRRINISEQEVKQVAKIIKQQGSQQMQFRIGHIQIALPDSPSSEELNAAKAKADRIMAALQSGVDFGQLAIAESNDARALEGGDWGWMNTQEMPTLMADAVQGRSKGDVVGPIRSGAGLHIIKLIDTKGMPNVNQVEVRSRHILLKPSIILTDEKAVKMLEGFLADVKSGKADFAALAKEYSDDPGSGVQGGELGWSDPNVYVPEFRDMLMKLEPGQYSQPFRTMHGWHIVQLEERRSEDATDKAIENRAYQLIYSRRFTEEVQNWLNELRDGAYIQIVDEKQVK